jgi:Plasmid pRiA4b ORF-3-like protein
MAQNGTLIIRAALEGRRSIWREIEIETSGSLYKLAEAIIAAFGFDFDHAFGFYSGLTPAKMMHQHPKYELFVDMGSAEPGAISVKRTSVARAFPAIGHTMILLFDYGDGWHFRVSLKEARTKLAKVRYPRVVAARGEAPAQYPDWDEDVEDAATYGINLVTGEKIMFGS